MTDQASQVPKHPPGQAVVDATAIPSPQETRNTSGNSSRQNNHHWTPTLRGVSLLNTLLFLGLALSHTKLQAHAAAAAAPSESQIYAHVGPTITTDNHEHSSRQVQVETAGPSKLSLPKLDDDDDQVEVEVELDDEFAEFESPSDEDDEESKTTKRKDFIVVAAVDGTLAAVEKVTGRVLWKKDGRGSAAGYRQGGDKNRNKDEDGMKLPRSDNNHNNNNKPTAIQGESKLLQPLVATTTTVSSTKRRTKQQETVAIPSIDGNVFITTASEEGSDASHDHDTSVTTTTDTASVRELVARAPYVDSSGRFYVGNRRSMVAALDSATGEILYVASADVDDDKEEESRPDWEGRDVIWIGRVDYVVSVYNAKSSVKEVQFSASEIMSVNDMVAGNRKISKPSSLFRKHQQNPNAMIGSSEEEGSSNHRWGDTGDDEEVFMKGATIDDDDVDSVLVATPSGNLAYRSGNTERVEWVSDLAFDTPIAYAIHTTSGQSLAVDIIPDVTNPANSKEEYLRDEIERQIELTLQDSRRAPPLDASQTFDRHGMILDSRGVNPSIVGTLLNGQLYSMPLGRQTTALPSHASLATTRTQAEHVLLDVTATGDHHNNHHHSAYPTASATGRESQGLAKWIMPSSDSGRISSTTTQDERQQFAGTNGICRPSTTSFPGCLFKAVSQRTLDFFPRKDKKAITEEGLKASQASAIETYNYYSHQEAIEPPQGHGQQQSAHQHRNKRKRSYRILKILGSWLPPTIALIFVVSFELGRRKRQKDALDNKLVEGNELITSAGQKDGSGGHVIQITDQLLGLGSNGTQVFRGTLDGRQVAVKRILKTYVASADREISLLIESDGHPNVVRYFLKEVKGDFVYLALELCDLSLHSLIGTLDTVMKNGGSEPLFDCISSPTKRILHQIAAGVRHLHSLRIVHNDLKPANILLAITKEGKSSESDSTSNEGIYNNFELGYYIAKISDMGLGKMLQSGQSSFGGCPSSVRGQSSNMAANGNVGIGPGTVGWMAPEAMRIKSSSSVASEASCDSAPSDGLAPPSGGRASRSVDIFSLGCIFYSTLVPGSHPFGEWYEREANIMHNRPNIESLQSLSVEAYNLVGAMIQYNPRVRPTSEQVVQHPYFWAHAQRLSFICDLSDRLETDSSGEEVSSGFSSNSLAIERNAIQVVGLAWDKSLHSGLTEQKYRTYDPSSVRDLLRLIRNKKNHYQDLDASLRQMIGSSTDGLMTYFESCFPQLLMHCYKVCCEVLDQSDPLVVKYSLSSANYPKHRSKEATRTPKLLSTSNTPEPITEGRSSSEQEISLGTNMDSEVVSNGEELEDLDSMNCEEKKDTDVTTDEHLPAPSLAPPVPLESTEDAKNAKDVTPVDEPQASAVVDTYPVDAIVWQGSTVARTLNCRGWIRSDEDWTGRSAGAKKRNGNLTRCAQDPKFRTRLCNHWDTSLGTTCPMRKKGKCFFAHGPAELRIKEGKKNRWGKLVDKNGNNANPKHSGGEDTYGAARSIESTRKEEGKWNGGKATNGGKKHPPKKKSKGPAK